MNEAAFLNRLREVSSDLDKPHLLWEYSVSPKGGHGCLSWEGTKKRASHVMWFITYGRWPFEQLNHICTIPTCVEPTHVYDGNQSQNQLDRAKSSDVFRCGHERTVENTYRNGTNKNGTPTFSCATCKRAKQAKRYWNGS